MEKSGEENVETSTANHELKLDETFDEKLRFVNSNEIKSLETLVFPKLSNSDFLKLTTVVLRSSNLVSLPDIPFINVVQFDLSDNRLFDLPMSLSSLNKLQTLNLSRNQFKRVPQCMAGGLKALKNLYLSKNQIVKLRSMASLRSLRLLDLHSNNINLFPEWLLSTQCNNLSELNISNNPVFQYETEKSNHEILDMLRKYHGTTILQTLKKLTLSNCQLIESCSEILELFPHLEELNLGNNSPLLNYSEQQLKTKNFLPKMPIISMMNMKNLSVLRLSDVSLTDFIDEISKFENLRILDCKNNYLNWLPNRFCDLKNLEVCDLSNNNLYCLPDNIGNLSNLSVLLLSSNRLSVLPESFGQLKTLKFLDLFSNQFYEVPDNLLNCDLQGMDFENNFFDSSLLQLKNTDYSTLLKSFRAEYKLNRMSGFRSEPEYELNEESSSSSDSAHPESFISSESQVENCRSVTPEENWDIEEDDDDLYNPYDPPIQYISTLKPLWKGKGFYFQASPPVEGQFDDAESD